MEKRIYPRVKKQFSAIVENGSGVNFKVMVDDASNEGVCIQCNTFERNQITPGGSFVSDGKPVELFIWLELPFKNGKAEKMGARCHVAFSRRISRDQCKIGVRYMDLDKNNFEMLNRYIESVSVKASNDARV